MEKLQRILRTIVLGLTEKYLRNLQVFLISWKQKIIWNRKSYFEKEFLQKSLQKFKVLLYFSNFTEPNTCFMTDHIVILMEKERIFNFI